MRERLSLQFIRGSGIEIGALHCPLTVTPGTKVTYVDHGTEEEIRKAHADVEPVHKNWVIDDAETLSQFKSCSQDFVIANHVFEHCKDPIRTIRAWMGVLKPGGMVYAAIPDKDHTFDRERAVTSFHHLQDDFHAEPGELSLANRAHYRDWFTNALVPDRGKDVEERTALAVKEQANIHFHVWDEKAIREMFERFRDYAPIDRLDFYPNGAEVIVLAWKATV